MDITLRCALTADGTAQLGAARVDGAVRTRAREDARGRSRLVVVDLETAGRMERGSCKVWQPSGFVMLNLLCTSSPHWLGGDGGLGAFQCHALVPSHQFAGGHAHSVACQGGADGWAPDLADVFCFVEAILTASWDLILSPSAKEKKPIVSGCAGTALPSSMRFPEERSTKSCI